MFSSVSHFMSQEKIGDFIEFPVEGLDMRPYVSAAAEPGKEQILYDLYGVSNHYGSLHGGHYTAFAMNPIDKNWYNFNDSSVGKVAEPSDVVTPGAYLLFYKRREV